MEAVLNPRSSPPGSSSDDDDDDVPLLTVHHAAAPRPAKRPRTLTPQLTPLSTPITVEPVTQRTFLSWEEADAYFSGYCARTFQILSVKSATPVSSRNATLRELLATKSPAQQATVLEQGNKIIPDHFVVYNKALVCTHSGKPRVRSKGERVNQHSRRLGCPAKVTLCVSKPLGGDWRVRVTDQVCAHNHTVSAELFALYPSNRRVTDPRVLEIVREMRRYGTPRKGIFEFIKKKTGNKNMIMKDIHNLLARLKKEDDEEEALAARAAGATEIAVDVEAIEVPQRDENEEY